MRREPVLLLDALRALDQPREFTAGQLLTILTAEFPGDADSGEDA